MISVTPVQEYSVTLADVAKFKHLRRVSDFSTSDYSCDSSEL